MAEHDGEKQFEAEGNVILDEEERELAEMERRAAQIRARRVLEGKDTYQVIGEDGSIESTGSKVSDALAEPEKEPWKYGTLEYLDDVWEYRIPKPLAAMFLGAASRKASKPARKIDAIMGYLEHVLSDDSLGRMMERAQDHEDVFDTEHMAELVRRISSEGSSRPTGSIRR
jgi:hypothetical protein